MAAPSSLSNTTYNNSNEELKKEKSFEEKIPSLSNGNLNIEELENEKSVEMKISSLPKGNSNNEDLEKEESVKGEEKISSLPKGDLNDEKLEMEKSVEEKIPSLSKGNLNIEEGEKEKAVEEKISSLPKGNLNNEELKKENTLEEKISSLPKGNLNNEELKKKNTLEEKISSLPKGNLNNEELNEKISSLPKAKGWITHNLYLYQGFWYDHSSVYGTIFAQLNFNARSTDIILATNPKCGTTWLKSLAFSIKHRATLPPQNEEPTAQTQNLLLNANPHTLIPYLASGRYSMEVIETLPSPRFIATHIPYSSLPESVHSSGCKVVYLCREPKDVFVSMWHFFDKVIQKEVPIISLQEAFEMFCEGVSFFGPYWDHVVGYYKASMEWPQRFMFLKYEDMQSDTLNNVKKLAEYLGYPFSLEEEAKGVVEEIIQLCSFENLSNLEVNKKGNLAGMVNNNTYFRKGKVGDSKNYLTDAMVERLNEITTEKFQGLELGY